MDQTTFEIADQFGNQFADALDELFESPEGAKLRAILRNMCKAVGSRFSVSLTCNLDVLASTAERCLGAIACCCSIQTSVRSAKEARCRRQIPSATSAERKSIQQSPAGDEAWPPASSRRRPRRWRMAVS